MDNVLVIGIAGGTGSGKTTITKHLLTRFGEDVSVIYHDNYYKAHHEMSYEERSQLNYDHPDALDTHLLIDAIKELKAGRPATCPVYDFSIHDRTDETTTILPTKVLVVEGILIFSNPEGVFLHWSLKKKHHSEQYIMSRFFPGHLFFHQKHFL